MHTLILRAGFLSVISVSFLLGACAANQTAQTGSISNVEPAAGSSSTLPLTTDQARGATY